MNGVNALRSGWVWMFVLAMICGTSAAAAAEEIGATNTDSAAQPSAVVATPASAPLAPAPQPKETVWVDEAVPTGAQQTGTWEWVPTPTAYVGAQSHTEPSAAALAEHGFTTNAQTLPEGSVIVQYVYLDPQQSPKGLMLKLKLADGSQTAVYWEGDEEVFEVGDEELSWYMDVLPEAGSWQRLEVWVDDFGLGGEQLTGLSYVTFGGKAYWDKTSLEEHPELLLESGEYDSFADEF